MSIPRAYLDDIGAVMAKYFQTLTCTTGKHREEPQRSKRPEWLGLLRKTSAAAKDDSNCCDI